MFGELIGAWAATVWRQMGAPARVRSGRARARPRHADGRRAARRDRRCRIFAPRFRCIWSRSARCCARCRSRRSRRADVPIAWHRRHRRRAGRARRSSIANEFFDALPVDQFVKDRDGWHVRMVGLDGDKLAFVLAPDPMLGQLAADARDAPDGAILEWRARPAGRAAGARASREHGGAALIIDYGHAETRRSATRCRRCSGHEFADPLAEPGEADLTAHVDFAALATGPRAQGARVARPARPRRIPAPARHRARAARLKANATPQQAADIDAALHPPHRAGPDGRAVQGAGDRRSEARRAAGI